MAQASLLELPKPSSGKTPLKANAYEAARQGNTQLLPLFPYLGPGDMVPCCAAIESGGKASNFRVGYFLHTNTVDEVAVSFGSGGGHIRTGDVHVGPREHGVGGDSDEPFFTIFTITQRQLEHGEQTEALAFQCDKCANELHRYRFSSADDADRQTYFAVLPTIKGSYAAAAGLNTSEEKLTCSKCGHVNQAFPLPVWGWDNYLRRTSIAERAHAALQEASR